MSHLTISEIEPKNPPAFPKDSVASPPPEILEETVFKTLLCRERKRSERSRKIFILMLVRSKGVKHRVAGENLLRQAGSVLGCSARETDVAGWFETGRAVGVLFTELGAADLPSAISSIKTKTTAVLQRAFVPDFLSCLQISFHGYPDDIDMPNGSWDPALFPDLQELQNGKKASLVVKRIIDIAFSALALLALAPVFLVLALAIKLTSKGPVFFRQQRVGRRAEIFTFLKFRSMRVATDPAIHRQYVQNFIAGKVEPASSGDRKAVYKITNDPRITWIGKFMRRTSLDELPQFWNVLKGDMSLVGPRPPIPYEIEAYDVWHRRRFLEVKPGITGLWQVTGRSKTTFDEMVRLDLRYAKSWTPMLDVKLLLQTPRAVVSGDGAY